MYPKVIFSFQVFFPLTVLTLSPAGAGLMTVGMETGAIVLTGQHNNPPCLMQV